MRKIAWQVDNGSSTIKVVEWEYETKLNYCYKRRDGTLCKYLKHPVGTSRKYFETWEEANTEVIRQAEVDLKNTIESIDGKLKWLKFLKSRSMREAMCE
jgi:hypothetical protein